MHCVFMHQIIFGIDLSTPAISLFILYNYKNTYVSENSSVIFKDVDDPAAAKGSCSICLSQFSSLATRKQSQSSKWSKQNWYAPHHILAVGQRQWLNKASMRGVLCVASLSIRQWKALNLDNTTPKGFWQQEEANSDYLYGELKS